MATSALEADYAPLDMEFCELAISQPNQTSTSEADNQVVEKSRDNAKAETSPLEPYEVAEDENSKLRWQVVLDCEAELAAHRTAENLINTAQRIIQYYHNLAERKKPLNIQRAFALAEQAEHFRNVDGQPPPHPNIAPHSMYIQGRMCRMMYYDTMDESWLRKAIEHTKRSIAATCESHFEEYDEMSLGAYRMEMSLRYDSLAMIEEELYLINFTQGPEAPNGRELYESLFESAFSCQKFTWPSDYGNHHAGETRAWERAIRWIRVRVMGLTTEHDEIDWEYLIHIASKHAGSPLQTCENAKLEARGPTMEESWAVTELMCRRWAHTKDQDHKNALLKHSCTNPDVDQPPEITFFQLANSFRYRLTGSDDGCPFRFHLASLNVAKKLREEVLVYNEPEDGISWPDRDSFSRNFLAVQDLLEIQWRIYKCTNDPKDAWLYDDRRWELIRKRFIYDAWHEEGQEDSSPLEDKGVILINQLSAIGDERINTWWTPGMSLKTPRLRFLDLDGSDEPTPTVDTWISDRTPEGRFVLGGLIEGRDDDVLRFIESFG